MRWLTLLILAVAIAAAACDDEPAAQPSESTQGLIVTTNEPADPIEARRQAWAALEIEDYRIRYERRNFNGMGGSPGDGIYDVTVRNGAVTDCDLAEGWRGAGGLCMGLWLNYGARLEPVTALFAFATSHDAAYMTVRFDDEWQIPIWIDYDDPDTFDEETRYVVHAFEPLG